MLPSIGNKAQEPDFVASLCLNFSPELYNILIRFFPKNKFAVTSVFCHQKPLADIKESKDPELGDLMLVYVHSDSKSNKKYNSILLQAKITSKQVLKVPAADAHQLKLYAKWPDFEYVRAGKLNGVKRSIVPKATNDGGQYLLIDDDPVYGLSGLPGTFPMGCASADPVLTLNNDFARELIEFLKFKSGRSFEEDPSKTKDEWTKMVWDLIDATKNKATKRNNVGLKKFARQKINQVDGYSFFNSKISSIFSELHNSTQAEHDQMNNIEYFDEENIGISMIVIESSDNEIEEAENEE